MRGGAMARWFNKWEDGDRYQGGGIVGDDTNFSRLFRFLGQDQLGTRRADTLTRMLSRHARDLKIGQLLRLQRQARKQIRRMARHGFTGPERIRTRRLQGGIAVLQDEMGRPIGRALGASDRAQERISRAEANLPNQLLVAGIDPDSAEGLTAQRTLAEQSLGTLGTRRAALVKQLRRAKKTHNKKAIRAVQGELNEVDDQMLGLQGAIVTLNKTMEQANDQAEQDRQRVEQLIALQTEANAIEKTKVSLAQTQGPALLLALAGISNGWIGGNAGLGRSFPSFAGLGGLART
jgi:chromosome segregation ATPase